MKRRRLRFGIFIWFPGAVAFLCVGGIAPIRPSAAQAADPPADASPMDEPLRLLAEARSSFEKVTDYTCTLVKRERINGDMTPDHVIAMSVRNDPFSVDLRWLAPRGNVGQEACYVAGRNDGKMRVKSAGLLGAVGFVSIDPNDPRRQKTSRHAIHCVRHAISLGDHPGHRTDADEPDILFTHVARDTCFIHGLRVAINQNHFVAGRSQRLQQKHPKMRHEVAGHAVVWIVQ